MRDVIFVISSEKWFSDFSQIERNMILMTVFLLIVNQIEFHSVQNPKKTDCNHILFDLRGIRNRFILSAERLLVPKSLSTINLFMNLTGKILLKLMEKLSFRKCFFWQIQIFAYCRCESFFFIINVIIRFLSDYITFSTRGPP